MSFDHNFLGFLDRYMPNKVRMMSHLMYYTGTCSTIENDLKQMFMVWIQQSIYSGACAKTIDCVAENIEVCKISFSNFLMKVLLLYYYQSIDKR